MLESPRMRRVICSRCKQRPARDGSSSNHALCDQCYGKCRKCGKPAPLMANGCYKPLCNDCRPKRAKLCARCGIRPKRGASNSFCEICEQTCKECGAPLLTAPRRSKHLCPTCRAKLEPANYTCTKCGKPRDGSHKSYCRTCDRVRDRERMSDPAKRRLKNRKRTLRKFYDMTIEEYEHMLERQGGVCAVCKRTNEEAGGKGQHLHVDHCHKTNRVRALLCHQCNAAMGNAGDDPIRLRALADYLEFHASYLKQSLAG